VIFKPEQQSAIESKEGMFARLHVAGYRLGLERQYASCLFLIAGKCVAGSSAVSLSSCTVALSPGPSPDLFS